jgi:hypothetical protein
VAALDLCQDGTLQNRPSESEKKTLLDFQFTNCPY